MILEYCKFSGFYKIVFLKNRNHKIVSLRKLTPLCMDVFGAVFASCWHYLICPPNNFIMLIPRQNSVDKNS